MLFEKYGNREGFHRAGHKLQLHNHEPQQWVHNKVHEKIMLKS